MERNSSDEMGNLAISPYYTMWIKSGKLRARIFLYTGAFVYFCVCK